MAAGGGYQSIFAAPSAGLFPATGLAGLEFTLRDFFRRDWAWGFDLAGGGTHSSVVVVTGTLPYRFSELSVATSLLTEWRRRVLGPVVPFVGVRLALLLMSRKFDDGAAPDQAFATLSPGLIAGARLDVWDSFSLVLRGRLHYLLYNVDESNRSLGYWEATAFVQYDFGGQP
jgi:hypothetical protein